MNNEKNTRREAYQAKLNARVDQVNAKIAEVKAKGDELQADAKIEWTHQLDYLNKQSENLQKRLAELQEAGEDTWEEIAKKTEEAWDDFSKDLEKRWEKFKEVFK